MSVFDPLPQFPVFAGTVPDMINQVAFEGFLARAWLHGSYRFLRLANQRLPEMGGQSDGTLMAASDYVTVRLDAGVEFDMRRAVPGLRLVVRGRVEGRDIPETLGEILQHCNLYIPLPQNISHITVTRPAVQIYCTHLEFFREQNNRSAGRWAADKHRARKPFESRRHASTPAARVSAPITPAPPEVPPVPVSLPAGIDLEEALRRLEVQEAGASTPKRRVKKDTPSAADAGREDKPPSRKSRRTTRDDAPAS